MKCSDDPTVGGYMLILEIYTQNTVCKATNQICNVSDKLYQLILYYVFPLTIKRKQCSSEKERAYQCVDYDKAQGTLLLVVYKTQYRIRVTSVADYGKFRLRYGSSTIKSCTFYWEVHSLMQRFIFSNIFQRPRSFR